MKITPEDSQNSCSFEVRRISATQKTRGRDGIIFTNKPRRCSFVISNSTFKEFWDKIVLLDFRYQFSQDMKLAGTAKLSTLNDSYNAVLKFEVPQKK